MRNIILLFLLLFSIICAAQTGKKNSHTPDSCNKCFCFRWHLESDIDTTDNSKIIYKYRIKLGSSSQCRSDAYARYIWLTTRYYTDGKVKSVNKENGWTNGKHKSVTIFYDTDGKETKRVVGDSKKNTGKVIF